MSATKECLMSLEEQCGLHLVGDYPNSGNPRPLVRGGCQIVGAGL